MRTSLTDIALTERYLQGDMEGGDSAVFEARLLTSDTLRGNMSYQQRVYRLLRQWQARLLRREAATVDQELFSAPEHAVFAAEMRALFKK